MYPLVDLASAQWMRGTLIGGRVEVLKRFYIHPNWFVAKKVSNKLCDHFPYKDAEFRGMHQNSLRNNRCRDETTLLESCGVLHRVSFLVSYDVNSLYPTAMSKWPVQGKFMRLLEEQEKNIPVTEFMEFTSSKHAIIEVDKVTPPRGCVFPHRAP